MSARILCLAVAGLMLTAPTSALAGGPARLYLPIDGVTVENASTCAELLSAKLDSRISGLGGRPDEVQLEQHQGQWYMTMYLAKDVALSQVEAALRGSDFSIPRDRLRLFGDVILVIEAAERWPLKLLADLDQGHVYASVAEAAASREGLVVTASMPYPGTTSLKPVDFEQFHHNSLSADQSRRSLPPATPGMLPSYDDIRELAARHGGSLKDVRWGAKFGCRPLGGVAAGQRDTTAAAVVAE